MKRYLICLVLGMALGVWGDRSLRSAINSLPLPEFAKGPIVSLYGK
jgi:hypothetical protein